MPFPQKTSKTRHLIEKALLIHLRNRVIIPQTVYSYRIVIEHEEAWGFFHLS